MIRTCTLSILLLSVASAQVPGRARLNANSPASGATVSRGGDGPNIAPVPEFAALKPVPHGEIHIVWYDSKTLGMQRRLHIYTPPGYDTSHLKYPVLYLIHGRTQDDATWSTQLRAGFILDNLLAAGKIKPMIVVMPNGATNPNPDRPDSDNTPAGLAARAVYAVNDRDAFLRDLVDDIIPYVEANYRALPTREDRAIAGLSFGGSESLWAGTSHLDKFGWIGVFSMGIQGGSHARPNAIAGSGSDGPPAEFVKANAGFFSDSRKTNKMVKLFWIGVGKDDNIVSDGPKLLSDTLTAHDIRNQFHQSDGGHDMANWQVYLRDFSELLFR